jgi:predicted transcriptional regulator
MISDDNPKQQVLAALRHLPDDASFSRIRSTLELVAAIEEGEDSFRTGRTFTQAEVEAKLESWRKQWRSKSSGAKKPSKT